jgi:ketosteroid isomerase-like protein
MPEFEIQALRRIYDALSRWDVAEFAADVTHDFELNLPETVPWGGTRHGRDGVEAFATIFQDHVEGQWADPDDFLEAGELIVVLGRLRGRGRATGEEFEVYFAHVWTLSDGVPSRCRSYFDTAPIMTTLSGNQS